MVDGTGHESGRNLPAYGPSRRLFNVALLLLLMLAGAAAARAETARLLLFGDSLTAGYGLPVAQGFPARLEAALRAEGVDVQVINGGVSGDTSAGGLERIDWALADRPTHVLLALGANDALRGLDPARTEANLDAIIRKVEAAGAKLLLVGMYAPRNLGRDYVDAFDGLYRRLAERHKVPLYPFFLEGVAADPALNQPDGIHPNAEGVAVMVRNILPYVKELLGAG